MTTRTGRTYRFGDSTRPGLVLGLSARQATPIVGGVLWLAASLQTTLPAVVGVLGPVTGIAVAFGKWHGIPLAETVVPSMKLWLRRRAGRPRWVRQALLGTSGDESLPDVLAGLTALEVPAPWITGRTKGMAVIKDRSAGTVTAALRVHGRGFPLASTSEQDLILNGWGGALTSFARERCPVSRVVWQEWAHPIGSAAHREFLEQSGTLTRHTPEADDYLALLDQHAPAMVAHEVLVTVTVDQKRVRARRRNTGSRFDTAIDVLSDEVRLFGSRLEAAGLVVDGPLSPPELALAVRVRSDPTCAAQLDTATRSLAAAAGRRGVEWGPMAVEPDWGHVRVDGSIHRTYRVASWPQLPVAADWLGPLLTETRATRTVCVVMEPVPMSRAARAADREVMAREADAEMKERKGFRVNAKERKRLVDVEARERELSEGHAEFRFVGLVDVAAPDLDALDDAAEAVEQAAGQSLIDLRPVEARHDQGWVACLPLGRNVANRSTQ
ncbi:MAG: PrgI family protein [Actinomycetota bacterium]|nr:PrgI family protein [Actinomycetota bacterium]